MPAYYLEAFLILLSLGLILIESLVTVRRKVWLAGASLFGLLACLVALPYAQAPAVDNAEMANFYEWDRWAIFYKGFALVATILVLLLIIESRSFLARYISGSSENEEGMGELYILPLITCAGLMWMASAKNLISLFVALELVTISFYVLVAYLRRNVGSIEAGVKYLVLGALSTGFLVYGIAWIYGATGTFQLSEIAANVEPEKHVPLLFGLTLVLIALAFKAGAVPMHIWIPDVYQGAPTPITAFLSVASKAAGFAVLFRVVTPFMEVGDFQTRLIAFFLSLAVATLLLGNLCALKQNNFKRLLAYSSIAHAGFLLLTLAAWPKIGENPLGVQEVVAIYLVLYLVMTFAAFFVLINAQRATGGESIYDFKGLGSTSPKFALAATIIMASLAGLPLTAGFWGKFFIFQAALAQNLWWGIAASVISVAAGFYYYLRIVRMMYWSKPEEDTPTVQMPVISTIILWSAVVVVLVLGVWPKPLHWLIGS